METIGNNDIWKFEVDLSNTKNRKALTTYQALIDHGSNLPLDVIDNFELSDLDDQVMMPITYAHLLLNDWNGLPNHITPTYKEFVNGFNHPEFNTKGFEAGVVSADLPPAKVPPGFLAGLGIAGSILNKGLDFAGMDADTARKAFVKRAQREIRARIRSRRGGKTPGNEGVAGRQGDDDGNSKSGYTGGSAVNPTGLSLNNKPMRVNFSTGIQVAGEPKFFADGKEHSAPLIMKSGVAGIVSGTADVADIFHDPNVYNWLSGPITNTWIAKIQSKIVWTNQISAVVTNSKIVRYMNYLTFALYVYYFYTSVIAYTDDPRNRNEGMYALRAQFDAQDYLELSMLKLNIQQSIVPPFLIKMCHYFSGNFKQSMDPGSPLIKILPWMMSPTNTTQMLGVATFITLPNGDAYSMLGYANKLMRDSSVRDMTAVLARSCPTWMDQEPMGYESLPEFDSDFCTFFSNATYTTMDGVGNVKRLPVVANVNDTIDFNLHSDAPDGWITSMLNIYVESTQKRVPGLFVTAIPYSDGNQLIDIVSNVNTSTSPHKSSEFIYSTANGITGWWTTSTKSEFSQLVSNTYQANYQQYEHGSFQRYGTGVLSFVNKQNITPKVLQMLELIYTSDLDSIVDPRGSRSGGSKTPDYKGKSKRSRSKRSGKSKSDTKVEVDIKD